MTRLPPSPASPRAARRVVAAVLTDLGRDDLLDDVDLVVSELVANAVMHARTDLELTVQEAGGGVRVAVSDGSRVQPHWTPASATAISGRGLILVRQLCREWGVEPHGDHGKTVWAQIDHPSDGVGENTVEDLLTLWNEDPDQPQSSAGDGVDVVLEVEVAAMLASRAHTEDLTRELQLIALGAHRHPVATPVLQLARRLVHATEALHGPRHQILTQSLSAAQRGQPTASLHLHLHPGDAGAAEEWLGALDEADALTTGGLLLLPPFPSAMTDFRRHYITAIVEALQR